MPCRLWMVTLDQLPDAWPHVEDKIAQAVSRHSLMDANHVYRCLEKGRWQLWIVMDGAIRAVVVTAVNDYPMGRECRLLICTGDGMKEWLPLLASIEAWAEQIGCKTVVAVARPGWERVLKGYGRTHTILEKRL